MLRSAAALETNRGGRSRDKTQSPRACPYWLNLMKMPQATSKAAAANAMNEASEILAGSSCISLKMATSDSIASDTITTTKKRDSTRRARAAGPSRVACSNSSSTMVWASSMAAIAMVNMAMQSSIKSKRLVSDSASLGCTARQRSMPEKAIKATAQPANRMTTTAKPIAKKRSENLVTDMAIWLKFFATNGLTVPTFNLLTLTHSSNRKPSP